MLRYIDIILVTQRNSSKTQAAAIHKTYVIQTFCAADNTKSDEMKIVFSYGVGVDGKGKQLKQRLVVLTNGIKTI